MKRSFDHLGEKLQTKKPVLLSKAEREQLALKRHQEQLLQSQTSSSNPKQLSDDVTRHHSSRDHDRDNRDRRNHDRRDRDRDRRDRDRELEEESKLRKEDKLEKQAERGREKELDRLRIKQRHRLKSSAFECQPRTDELTALLRPHPEPNNTPYGKLTRIEFLKFSGDDVKDWYVKKYPDNTPWEHFETGSVQTYQEVFEALLNRVDLPELVAVKATNTILKPRYNTPLLPTPKQSTTTCVSKVVTTPVKSNSVGQSSGYMTRNRVHKPYRLTQRELEDKRAKSRYFYCDQKYAPGHKCSGQLHSIEVICEDDFDNYIDDDDETYQDFVGDMVGVTGSPQITLNALSGLNSYQTIRVRDRVGKQVVHILIDCGSTHNFLDTHTAKKLGCRLAKTTPMQVSVANEQRMMSTSVCHDLK
nr:hypothetical protein [Tanacetum cinerariifolium]